MNKIFDTKWARTDTVKRLRHGMPWSDGELRNLRALYMNGASLCGMAETLQRPADGVISKLSYLNLIKSCSATLRYLRLVLPDVMGTSDAGPSLNYPKEITMNKTANIEHKTFINGSDAEQMSDTDIFKKIANLEAEIAKYEQIKAKPAKLVKVIGDLQADILKLVEFVDGRP